MSFTGLNPKNGEPKKPSVLRDELQHVLGVAVPDCILKNDDKTYGGKLTPGSGTTISISALKAIIGSKYHRKDTATDLVLPVRKALLVYALRNADTDSVEPSFGYVAAADPVSFIDDNTVGMWKPDGSATCPNLAVGVSAIAVANDLIKSGTVIPVDGLFGNYGAQGDGTSGGYVSSNYTGFGTSERVMAMLITYKQTGTNQTFGFYGSGGYVSLGADVSNNLNVINNSGTFVSTNFQLVDSNTYYIELCIDSAGNLYLYVNGILVWSNVGYTITNTLLKILSGNNTNYSSSTINFIELRNKIRTPSQIAQITNKLCLPCSYDSISLYTNGMTANIMPDGNIAFASSEMTGNNAYKAFDGNQLDSFWSTNNIVTGYLKRKYPLSFKTNQYSITSRNYAGVENRAPKNWTLEGSNNGSTWDIIDTQTNITFNMGEKKTFNIFPVNTYNEYRLNITANNGGDRIEVAELVIVNTEGTVTDIRSELPADAISLGRVLTGSSAVKEIRMDYQDGRREGAFGGNRRVFLGRKYFSGAATLIWDNPFGTRKVRGEYKWAQDANGTNEVDLYNIDGSYGYIRRGRTDGKLSIITNSNGVASLDGVNKTSGYIGCYAEVLEDDN